MIEKCQTCWFWNRDAEVIALNANPVDPELSPGECRFTSPKLITEGMKAGTTQFSLSLPDEWCGEYKPYKETKELKNAGL